MPRCPRQFDTAKMGTEAGAILLYENDVEAVYKSPTGGSEVLSNVRCASVQRLSRKFVNLSYIHHDDCVLHHRGEVVCGGSALRNRWSHASW